MFITPDLNQHACGGSLISDKHVLTSAWCAFANGQRYVHLGDTILGNDKDVNFNKTVEVTNKYIHPNYVDVDPFNENNIAILELAEPVALDQYGNLKPVCLPAQGADFAGYTATVTGWGEAEEIGISNSWLHEVQVTVFDDCLITPSELCAGAEQGSEAPCLRDDGGPLVVGDPNVNNNGLTLIGIVGYTDCSSVQTYTKVSMFIDWINEIIDDSTKCVPPPIF